MKKPSRPPSASSRPGKDADPAFGRDGGTKSGKFPQALGAIDLEIADSRRNARSTLLAFLRLERADRIDERTARLQPLRGPVEQAGLELGVLGDHVGRAR